MSAADPLRPPAEGALLNARRNFPLKLSLRQHRMLDREAAALGRDKNGILLEHLASFFADLERRAGDRLPACRLTYRIDDPVDLGTIDRVALRFEQLAKGVRGVSSSLAERLTGGRYINVEIDRIAAARYGLIIADVQDIVAGAVGGESIAETVEGLARFPINLRYPREWRDSPEKLATLPILTMMGQQITLGTVARIHVSDGPPMLKSENARPSGWV